MDSDEGLRSIIDFRDVGKTTGIKPGKLFRSSRFVKANRDDRAYLQDTLKIDTIIDLQGPPLDHYVYDTQRLGEMKLAYEDDINVYNVLKVNVYEINLASQAFRKAQVNKMSLMDKAKAAGSFIFGREKEAGGYLLRNIVRHQSSADKARELLALSQKQLKAIFDALANDDNCYILICGPNTGLVVILVLSLLHVPLKQIIHDYTLSERHKDLLTKERTEYLRERKIEYLETHLPALEYTEEFVRLVVEYLDVTFQGIEKFLAKIGVSEEQMQRIRAKFGGGWSEEEPLINI